jgi:periplasmic copper chaperone A
MGHMGHRFLNLSQISLYALEKGERIKGTLTFERTGTVIIKYPVEAVGARAMEQGGDHMQHQH